MADIPESESVIVGTFTLKVTRLSFFLTLVSLMILSAMPALKYDNAVLMTRFSVVKRLVPSR
jgi:hypothetical protein